MYYICTPLEFNQIPSDGVVKLFGYVKHDTKTNNRTIDFQNSYVNVKFDKEYKFANDTPIICIGKKILMHV